MLELTQVSKTFYCGCFKKHETKAVKSVDLALKEGMTLGIAGNSGCGKSTLSRMILGLIPSDEGVISFQGKDISTFTPKEWKNYRKKVQLIFQNPQGAMNPMETMEKALLTPMKIHENIPKNERLDRILHLMDLAGLSTDLLSHYPHEISGGEAQRFVICRGLTLEPELLVLDEPTSMLDVSTQASIMELLQDLKKTFSLTYLFISHDLDLHQYFSEELLIMEQGKVQEVGQTKQILTCPQVPYTQSLVRSFAGWCNS